MIRPSFLLTAIAAVMVAPGATLAQIAPCAAPVVHRPGPAVISAPPNTVGCERGVRLTVGTASLFRCQVLPDEGQKDLPEGSPEHVILLDRPGQDRLVLRDDLMAGRFEAFEVLVSDLDGDQRPEHVLAAWNAQGNGLGINRWTIRVFDPDWSPIATFDDVADWGDSSLVAAPGARAGCDLAITDFVEHIDAQRGEGIALRARFYRLDDDRMVPAADRPTLTRRYTFAFQAERRAHFRTPAEPIKGDITVWLSHPTTQAD